jgi:phosphatidylserine/phosphatidylglycerophosphate/cardiolipin synthase-like enzyme
MTGVEASARSIALDDVPEDDTLPRRAGEDPGAEFSRRQPILAPGRNCWRIAHAHALAPLIDAANYYARLDRALRQARRSILIVGWDFDGRIRLRPDQPECPQLGDLLRSLVETYPQLQIHILIWSVAVIHAPGAPLPLLLGAPWQDHPRITLRLDTEHPIYASHHQKIVTIDDSVAFVGGIDLTVRRWDTDTHADGNPLRLDPDGAPYNPVHDIQVMLGGEAARSMSALARERWQFATGETLEPVGEARELWPEGEADFADIPVAIARSSPAWAGRPAIREIADLTYDAIAAARHCIYIEAQYLTQCTLGDRLVRHLRDSHGPEIVIVLNRTAHGFMERVTMGINRDRMVRRLRQADRFDRLRVLHPVVPGKEGECEVHVHSKVLIVDDVFLRIGSSNLCNRSIALDTECDIAIEAAADATREAIAHVRDRLLAEHLDASPTSVAAEIARGRSLVRAIEVLNAKARGLRKLDDANPRGPAKPLAGTWLLDPKAPFEPGWFLRRSRARRRRKRG